MSTDLDVIREKALEAHARQELLVAEQHYRTLLKKDPYIDDAINLGALLRAQGRLQEGSLYYQKWISHFKEDARLIVNACNCWNDNNEPHISIKHIEPLIKGKQAGIQLGICYADTLNRLNRLEECINVLHQCLKNQPDNKAIWIRIGLAHAKKNNLDESLQAFEKVNQIDPNDLEATSNRITILKDKGDFDKANSLVSELSDSQRHQVDIAQANAGLLMKQNKLVEATKIYQHICKVKPQNANFWLNWAAALRGLRWTVAPYRILQRALCYDPYNENVQEALLQILGEMARYDAVERCNTALQMDTRSMKSNYLFNRQFLGIGTGQNNKQYLAEQARLWEKKQQSTFTNNLWQDTIQQPLNQRKLRIGYLSADFANHPVGRFLLPILTNHDHDLVEIWGLSCGSHDDWITDHIRKRLDHWVDLRFKSIPECARIVADIGLDIIIELGGFSADSHLELLCYRPAPIQLSYLGYPGPTYLKCIDGWIGDTVLFEQLEPIDRAAHPLIEIDGGYMVFDTGGELPMPRRTAKNKFRFGSFNHARKLTQSTIELFCEVMRVNPESELALKSISFCEPDEKLRIRQRFEKAGLPSDRLLLLDWVEGGLNHLQLYSEIDVALDPIPYGGATTTAEALWMGVPVIALAGEGMVGRLAASLLTHGNQHQWVAQNKNEYIQIASDLARQGPRSEEKRYKLRLELQRSPLADGKRLSKELEKLYLKLRSQIS
ncbi:hypothetical protein [Synechococcus sp. HIMB2401]|uniref:O-linked N-acetylglucosamine transferase, SPINDLY family protein n=1 Tax=Synechococcus sp. HIMB2401 TaxID=3144208 RepID=UPI0036F3F25A